MLSRQFKRWAVRAVKSSSVLTCTLYLGDGVLAKFKGSTHNEDEHLSGLNLDDDYEYAAGVAAQYLKGGEVSGRVAEVGPGGNAAVALHLLAQGADSVDLLDRFAFTHSAERLDELYRRFANYADLSKVTFNVGEPAAAENFFGGREGYDGIFSCAVLEHASDPIRALEAMIAGLRPGGRMVHQVDLRDHGMFSSGGKHPLTFLRIPEFIYRPMTQARGRPNRVLIDDYRRALEKSGLAYRILATHLIEVGELPEPLDLYRVDEELLGIARRSADRIRPKLNKKFRHRVIDDLIVSGIRIEVTNRTGR